MTVSQETSAAQDIFKRRYVDGVTSQLPEFAILQDAIKFDAENKAWTFESWADLEAAINSIKGE